jgi:alpha-tubulin suppressor-like RCC1 family protein
MRTETMERLGVVGAPTPARNLRFAALLICAASVAGPAEAQTSVVSWGSHLGDTGYASESFVEIAAGAKHVLARRADGTVVAWGENLKGQCDVPVLGAGSTYVAIAAGGEYSVAIKSDGSLAVWGVIAGNPVPPSPPPGTSYVRVSVGAWHAAAVRSDGAIVFWGGCGPLVCDVAPLPAGTTYVDVAAGYGFTLALRSDGVAVGWGANIDGVLNVPALPPGLAYVELAAAGDSNSLEGDRAHALARRSDGVVVSWGQLGTAVPALPSGTTYVEVAAGFKQAVARRSDGAVVAWGANDHAQCDVPVPPPGNPYAEIAANGFRWTGGEAGGTGDIFGFVVARRSDGSIVTWGAGDTGVTLPPPLAAGRSYMGLAAAVFQHRDVAEGYQFTAVADAALRDDGTIAAWGSNAGGVNAVPPPPPGVQYVRVLHGAAYVAALRSDGSLVRWGTWGIFPNVPAPPAGLTYVAAAAGPRHMVAVRSDGTMATWGANLSIPFSLPAIPPGLGVVEVAAGGRWEFLPPPWGWDWGWTWTSAARLSNGSVLVWGDVADGQNAVPPLPPGVVYVQISVGGRHVVALRSDGGVAAWGDNAFGQCLIPYTPVGNPYVEVAAGGNHTLLRRADGTVLAVGDNAFGQCDVPPPAPGFGFERISAFGRRSAAIRAPLQTSTEPLTFGQPYGPGGAFFVQHALLTPGVEYFGLASFELAPNGPGTGLWAGLSFSDLSVLALQLTVPIEGGAPFHFLAPASTAIFGPYALPPGVAFDATRFHVLGGTPGGFVPAVRFVVN